MRVYVRACVRAYGGCAGVRAYMRTSSTRVEMSAKVEGDAKVFVPELNSTLGLG